MKKIFRVVFPYLPSAILPEAAYIITIILLILRNNSTSSANSDIFDAIALVFFVTAVMAILASIVFPTCNTLPKAFVVTLPTFITTIIVFVFYPITRVEIHETEDYIVYPLLCFVIPMISLIFWFVLIGLTLAGARFGTLIKNSKFIAGFRKN